MGSLGGAEELARLEKAEAGASERILVSVRLRPLNSKEVERNDLSEWECINNNTVLFKGAVPEKSILPTAFAYDRVFGCESATRQVYEEGAKEVALSVVGGINSSIFAYGQTSSGKTYTMTGITEYSMEDIYDYVENHTEREFVLKFSAMEIYNESVKDLLSPDSGPLRLLDDPEKGTVVEKLTEETLRDRNHLRELLSVCEAQRQIGETLLNEVSSRSHQILRLTIESSAREFLGKDNLSTLSASVNFVDLAGSERASQALTAGSRLKEGCHINRSLLTLGTVIRKLSKGRNGHVPYRDSKLTRILQNSLGGNARTAIICTMSPARSHIEQSRNTLLFASCAKEVSTNAQVNVVMSDKALVKHLQRELARLENELKYSGLISPSATLQEKDSQIKKMEKEMKELMKQRDLAQSRLEDLLRVVGEDRPTQWEEFNQFSVPRAPITCEDVFSVSDTSGVAYQIPDFDFTSYEGSHGSSNQREKRVQSYSTKDNGSSPSHSISSTMSVGMFPHLEAKSEDFDHCKEVRCIEVDGSYTSINDEFDLLLTEDSDSLLPPTLDENGNEEQELETKGTLSTTKIGETEKKDLQVKTKESLLHPSATKAINNLVKPYSDETSHVSLLKDLPNSMSLVLSRSRSCRARLMASSLDPWFQEGEEKNSMLPNGFLKDVSERTGGVRRRGHSAFNCGVETNSLSGEGCLASEVSTPSGAYKDQNSRSSKEGSRSPFDSVEELKQMALIQYQRQHCPHTDHQEKEQTEKGGSEVHRDVKNVGFNSSESPSKWLLEFETKQGEIIKLWDVCHVSLVHRTYFFLLFKGDPSDSIYLEVEYRRLSFLKSASFGGSRAIGDVQNATLASSMKDIRREREMLRKQMLKRLSEEEREALYRKWGIAVDSKQRRMQLARRLWTETGIEHVRESASLVAMLIGLPELEQPLKEMFGLNFAPQITNLGSFCRKNRVSSFM